MKRPLLYLAGLLLVAILAWPLTPATAQGGGWTTPFEVSPPTPDSLNDPARPTATPLPINMRQPSYGASWFPSMAIGPDGSVHVTWYSGFVTPGEQGGSTDLLMYRELRDGAWTPVNNVAVAASGGYTVRNSMVMSRDGRLHVLYRSGTGIRHMSAPWDRAWTAASWSEPDSVGNNGYYVALGVDQQARLHAFWSQGVADDPARPRPECPGCANLFYRYSDSGGAIWSEPTNLSGSPYGDNRPQVKIDSRDRVHVVWDQGQDWYTGRGQPRQGVYRRSDDRGETWRAPVYFTVPDDAVQQTTLGMAGGDNPIAVYRTLRGRVYFQFSRNGGDSWTPPEPVPGVIARDTTGNALDQYSMATDGSGNVHLLMVGYPAATPNVIPGTTPSMLLHLVWNGSRWSIPEIVSANELFPEWPVIAVSNGNRLHAVWYTRRADGRATVEDEKYRVWYSSRQLDAPETAPLPLFTATPTAAPTEAPTALPPTPVPTPLPDEVAQAPAITSKPRWEVSALSIIGIALLPSLGIIAGVYALRRRRR
ncbi:MAG: exo-alpha-sialidase [Chloroflexi bacterium]|nr:exo-alpha-sialidase [Chloroflexota bacterium]